MTKFYIKIFIGFWLINILTILLHNVWAHWFDLGPANALLRYQDNPYDRFAVRGINSMVDAIIHWDLSVVRNGVSTGPEYIYADRYVVDDYGNDLRGREIPPKVQEILDRVNAQTPFYKTSEEERSYAGRYILLPDGNGLKIVSFATPFSGRRVLWQLYLIRNWQFFLISILISGVACFIFAHHMSRDFNALRRATRDIAKGDLSVRLSPKFGRRKDEIAELGHDFDDMTTRLETSMQEQKRLIKDVSHELRSPLARLQFALGIVQQRSNDDVKEELEKARSAADYLNDIITTILSFPTSEADTWELNDAIDIHAALEMLTNSFQEEAAQKGIVIETEYEVEEALVATYSNTLIGVFENIIRNAIHYSGKNTTILIKLAQSGGNYVVTVTDQGPGVDEAELADIFQPFYRTDKARGRDSGGYGLGLSIAQRTVELHKGQITAFNNPERCGLIVKITLPRGDYYS